VHRRVSPYECNVTPTEATVDNLRNFFIRVRAEMRLVLQTGANEDLQINSLAFILEA